MIPNGVILIPGRKSYGGSFENKRRKIKSCRKKQTKYATSTRCTLTYFLNLQATAYKQKWSTLLLVSRSAYIFWHKHRPTFKSHAAGPTVEERKLEKSVGPIFASSSSSSSSSSSKKRKKPSAPNAVQKLALKAALQTRKKMDPFLSQNSNTANAESVQVKPTKRTRQSSPDPSPLVAYDSD